MWRVWVEERGVYRVLVGKPVGRRPLGRPRRRWADKIRTNLQEVACVYMDWIGLAQDRDRWRALVSAVMNLRVAWNAGNFLTSCRPVSFTRRTLHHGVSKYVAWLLAERLICPVYGWHIVLSRWSTWKRKKTAFFVCHVRNRSTSYIFGYIDVH